MARIHISHQISVFKMASLNFYVQGNKHLHFKVLQIKKKKKKKSKPFYGFGDYIGKQVRGEINIFFYGL